jgi:hypothetical protein
LQQTSPSSRVTYFSVIGHSRQTNFVASSSLCSAASYSLVSSGKARFQSLSSRTACMNSSVTSSERLNWRSRPASRFARMNSIESGWPTSKVPICAPRRPPADDTVKHILS